MGAWGTGIFDNDSAADWAATCGSKSGLSLIERAFGALLDEADPDDPDAVMFVDADDALHAAAAADALARLLGIERPTNAYCETLATWAEAERRSLVVPADLVGRAIMALDSVLSDTSELSEMWAEDGRESPNYRAWRASITELQKQLSDSSGASKDRAFRLDDVVRRAKENDRIALPEGTYRLSVRPKVKLAIAGRSVDETRITLSRRLTLSTSLALQDLAIDAGALAFEVAGGALSLERVNVAAGGSAVFVHGGGTASLRECELVVDVSTAENVAGVEAVGAQSQVTMEGGSVRGPCGVFVHDRAHALLRNVRLVADRAPAVRVHAASVVIEHGELQGGESGLYVRDGGRAVLRACSLARSKLPQIEAYESFVRMVGGSIVDGKDDGINAHVGAKIEVESVRFSDNDIAVRVLGGRAKLLDLSIDGSRSAAVVAQDDAEIDVQGGTIRVGEGAALEAFDRGVIRARHVACENAEGQPLLAYDDGHIEYEPPSTAPRVVLDDVGCWRLIALAREAARAQTAEGELESRVAAHLVEALAKTDIAAIARFDHFVCDRLADAHRWDLRGIAYVMNGGCSDDGFDCFLGWLIGQGRERYSAALLHPDLAAEACTPDQAPFENQDMLGVGSQAYLQLTGSSDVADFHEVYAKRVQRTLAGTPFDENAIAMQYPSLARFGAHAANPPSSR